MSESMHHYTTQASDTGINGQLIPLIFISLIMGLGKGGVPGFATIATALVVTNAPVNIEGGLGFAVALMVPILTMIDVCAAWLHKESLDWLTVWILFPMSFVGMILGQLLDRYLTDSSARILVGLILLGLLLLRAGIDLNNKRKRRQPDNYKTEKQKTFRDIEDNRLLETTVDPSKTLSMTSSFNKSTIGWACMVGLFGGAATMLTNSMGPILNLYLLSIRKLTPTSFIGTRAMFFCFLNVIKLPLRFTAGTLGWPMIPLAAGLGCVAIIGVCFAKPIMLKIPEKVFVRLELLVVVFAGSRLLWVGLH